MDRRSIYVAFPLEGGVELHATTDPARLRVTLAGAPLIPLDGGDVPGGFLGRIVDMPPGAAGWLRARAGLPAPAPPG